MARIGADIMSGSRYTPAIGYRDKYRGDVAENIYGYRDAANCSSVSLLNDPASDIYRDVNDGVDRRPVAMRIPGVPDVRELRDGL